jgi:serine/threonine protein kinase
MVRSGWLSRRRLLELRDSPLAAEPTVVAGPYAVGERLGAGGMGDVFRARDLVAGGSVAFKQLRSPEAGIIEVYDYGVTREGPYYTMELLDGADLLASALSLVARSAVTWATSPRRWRCCTPIAWSTATSARTTCG